jgi:hypothetical protein
MNLTTAKKRIENAGYQIQICKRTGARNGYRLEIEGGRIVNIYDTGNVSVQGRRDDQLSALFQCAPLPTGRNALGADSIVSRLKAELIKALSNVEALEKELAQGHLGARR